MVPLTDIIRRLASDVFGLNVSDAAAVFGTPEAIRTLCQAAGFQDVQVILLSCPASQYMSNK